MLELIFETWSDLIYNILSIILIIISEYPRCMENIEVILLHKKGDKRRLDNYQLKTILVHLFKLLEKIITNLFTKKMDDYHPSEQAVFIHYESTDQQM